MIIIFYACNGVVSSTLCTYRLRVDIFVDGKFCKDPDKVTADHLLVLGINILGNVSNPLGSMVTAADVQRICGLNTFGIYLA
ncbi:hypothetical protein SAY87_025227 [Trapa incisa]|uniref:Uncharacterized protein n=1 Tax=Trapa incisa TaxID=236973 RepID=A0AAN7JFM1_9MYRT|nr:hypothetical protein SAY87_025227 [Trapa incisa]